MEETFPGSQEPTRPGLEPEYCNLSKEHSCQSKHRPLPRGTPKDIQRPLQATPLTRILSKAILLLRPLKVSPRQDKPLRLVGEHHPNLSLR